MDFRIRLPGNVYRYAKERAGGTDVLLRRKIEEWTQNYAHGQTAQQRGGRVSADRMTPEQRSDKMRTAVNVRWDAVRAAETEADKDPA
jgi:hypothetical protein